MEALFIVLGPVGFVIAFVFGILGLLMPYFIYRISLHAAEIEKHAKATAETLEQIRGGLAEMTAYRPAPGVLPPPRQAPQASRDMPVAQPVRHTR